MNSLLHRGYCTIDMLIGAQLQTLCKLIVFIVADILTGFAQEIKRYMQTSVMIIAFVYFRMVFQVLAIIDSCFFDLPDGGIDTANGFYFVYRAIPIARTMLDHPAGRPKIG